MGAKASHAVLPESSHDLAFIPLLLLGPFIWAGLDWLLTHVLFYWPKSPWFFQKLACGMNPVKFQKVVHHMLYIFMFVETGVGFGILALPELISSWGDWDPYARSWKFDRAFLFIGVTNFTFYLWDAFMIGWGAWRDRHVPGTDKWVRIGAEVVHHTVYILAGAMAFFKLSSYSVTILYMIMDVIEIPMRCVLIYYQLCENKDLRMDREILRKAAAYFARETLK